MMRLSTLASRAALAVAVAMTAVALVVANAASAEEPMAGNASLEFNDKDGTLNIEWSGPIARGMADYLRSTFATYGAGLHRVILFLDSAGGQVEEGDRVIHVLDELKQTRRLVTVVQDDKLCASMCIPIFLQGNDRLAGRASGWIFHEVTGPGADKKELKQQTLQLLDRYYVPAGVSADWIKRIIPIIERANLWQCGGDLIKANTGIVMHPLEMWTERIAARSGDPAKLEAARRTRSNSRDPASRCHSAPNLRPGNARRDRASRPRADRV
jgi:hypothetical protein